MAKDRASKDKSSSMKKFKFSATIKSFLFKSKTPLNTLPKGIVSQTITAIAKLPCAVNFLYPVSSKLYPEYYEEIDTPMDVSTIQDKIKARKYATLQEIFGDLQLIWDNCRQYNLEGSGIYTDADQLQQAVCSLFEEKFSVFAANLSDDAEESLKRKREAVSPVKARKDIDLSFPVMTKMLQQMKTHECSGPFLQPVSLDEAPGYTDIVSHPMDFQTIGRMLKSGQFTSGTNTFVSTMTLVWSNCYAYNASDSEIYEMAQKLEAYFDELMNDAMPPVVEVEEPTKKKIKKERSMPVIEKPTSEIGIAIQAFITELSENPRAAPFLNPVDEEEAPGYRDMIKEPIDLSVIQSRIAIYEGNPYKLLADCYLMFDNCQKYNVGSSEIYKAAGTLRKLVQEKFADLPMPPSTASTMLGSSTLSTSSTSDRAERLERSERPTPQPQMAILPSVDVKYAKVPPPFDPALPLYFRVELETAAYLKKTPNSTEGGSMTLSLTVGEADKLLESLVAEPNGNNRYVAIKAHQLSVKALASVVFPFASITCSVQCFGYLEENLAKIDGRCVVGSVIAPNGYVSCCKLRIFEKGQSVDPKAELVHFDLMFISFITYKHGVPVYAVALKNGTTVAYASHPRDAWAETIACSQDILRHVGGKLKRCRAVLNRLCTNPLIGPFLDKINPSTPEGKEYYNLIKAPMWFSEVHARLIEGAYANEYEFMFDVELIFENCMSYNKSDSALYLSAKTLQTEFEQLICQWVVNVMDRSVTDVAKGPWDQWSYLRYFDAPTTMVNVCRASGQKSSESSLLFCVSCEDQYLPSAIGVTHGPGKKNWKCERCRIAEEMKGSLSLPLCVQGYSADEYGWSLFTRAPDIGDGWYKSVSQATHPRVMYVAISPLGDRIENTPAEIDKCKRSEALRIAGLTKARTTEFAKELKSGHRLTLANRRKLSGQSSVVEISRGAFANLDDSDVQYDWFLVKLNDELVTFSMNDLPETGFFGLHEPLIKGRIEGLKNANLVPNYVFSESHGIRNSFIIELTKSKESRRAKKLFEERANESLVKERFFWELEQQARCSIIDRKGGSSIPEILTSSLYENVSALFPEDLTSEEGEILMAVWDFLSSTRSFSCEMGLSFHEVVQSVNQSSNPLLPSQSQVVFDEICCCLVTMLMDDTKNKHANIDAETWLELLSCKPINILTWPTLANHILILMVNANGFPTFDVANFLRQPLEGENLIRLRLLTLIISHPFLSLLVNYEKKCSNSSFDMSFIRRKCYAGSSANGYLSTEDFVNDIDVLWLNTLQESDGTSKEYITAKLFEKWFTRVLGVSGINVPRKSATPVVAMSAQNCATTHPSTWVEGLKMKSFSDFPYTLTRSFDNYSSQIGFGSFYGAIKVEKVLQVSIPIGDDCSNAAINELRTHPACFGSACLLDDDYLFMAKVQRLETTLFCSATSNPDFWTKSEKIRVLSTLIDFAASTSTYKDLCSYAIKISAPPKTALHAKGSTVPMSMQSKVSRLSCRDLSDVPNQPRHVIEAPEEFILPKTADIAQVRCFYSGAEGTNHRGEAWVYVPDYLLKTPSGQPLLPDDSSRPVAIKSLVSRVAAAREIADDEHRVEMDRELVQLQFIHSEHSEEPIAHIKKYISQETSMLGHDRHGSEYWILSAQDLDTLIPLYKYDFSSISEPAVLIRLKSGWWGRHSGHDLHELFSSFSPNIECEKDLRSRLIDRLCEVQRNIHIGAMAVKRVHAEWFANQAKVDDWLHFTESSLTDEDTPVASSMTLVELFYARCIENRASTLCAILNKNECPEVDEPPPPTLTRLEKDVYKKRRLKELLFEDFLDLHFSKGWVRNDTASDLKWLYATTMASRLLADPTIFVLHKQFMMKCNSRRSKIPIPLPILTNPDGAEPEVTVDSSMFVGEVDRIEEKVEVEPVRRPSVPSRGIKPIEQIEISTGTIVHRYPSGKDAAAQMQASQGSISLCCNGLKKEAYNFAWRTYLGPPIDFDEDNKLPGRKTVAELLPIRYGKVIRGGSGVQSPAGREGNRQITTSRMNPISSKMMKLPIGAGNMYSTYTHPRGLQQEHFVSSVVVVDYRLVKLKTELINMLLLLPKHLVNFKAELDAVAATSELPETGTVAEAATGSEAVTTSAENSTLSPKKSDGNSESNMATFMDSVQNASGPQELLDCVIFFEKSIVPAALFQHVKCHLPTTATSAANVAMRLFALDRSIRYEDINNLNLPCLGKYKPRVQFVPRCVLSSTCSKPLGHGGRCNVGFENDFSRFLEVSENAPDMRVGLQAPLYTAAAPLNAKPGPGQVLPNTSGRFNPPAKRTAEELAAEAARKKPVPEPVVYNVNYDEIEIENVVPYVPKPHELRSVFWV